MSRRMLPLILWMLWAAASPAFAEAAPAAADHHPAGTTLPGGAPDNASDSGSDQAMTDILDIRPPVAWGIDPRWRIVALAVIVIVLAAAVLVFLGRRRRRVETPPPAPAEPPDRVALSRLAGLGRDLNLTDREFYFSLTETLRAYLDDRFGLDTLEKTTQELLPLIRRVEVDGNLRDRLAALFRDADPVKFAARSAGAARRDDDLAFARRLVEATRRTETA